MAATVGRSCGVWLLLCRRPGNVPVAQMRALGGMQPDDTNYYDVLGLKPSASPKQIKSAYYSLSKQYHPDTTAQGWVPSGISDDESSASKFVDITEAYNVLSNPQKRHDYDRKLAMNTTQFVNREQFDRNTSNFDPFGTSFGASQFGARPQNFDWDYGDFQRFQKQRRRRSKQYQRHESHVPPEYHAEPDFGAQQNPFYKAQAQRRPSSGHSHGHKKHKDGGPSSSSSANFTSSSTTSGSGSTASSTSAFSDAFQRREAEIERVATGEIRAIVWVSGVLMIFVLGTIGYEFIVPPPGAHRPKSS